MHFLNPFHFVPLPEQGPIALSETALKGPRYEGYITYSLEILTPLHINGETFLTKEKRKNGKVVECFAEKKCFRGPEGRVIVPGSSVRGVLASFIEAATGSDLYTYTRGDEGYPLNRDPKENTRDRLLREKTPYAKEFGKRHVGFLMMSSTDPLHDAAEKEKYSYTHLSESKIRHCYERHEILPHLFGQGVTPDAASFLFGRVSKSTTNNEKPPNITLPSQRGRVMVEDLIVSDDENDFLKMYPAWDVKGDAIMGGPNPRASTGWYFKPAKFRVRKYRDNWNNVDKFVCEALAGKVRGRKFYFHQTIEKCHMEYAKRIGWGDGLKEYSVEAIASKKILKHGRIYFSDLSGNMLQLLLFSMKLENGMAHKLGGLKPFGFGSVKFKIEQIMLRNDKEPFESLYSAHVPDGTGVVLYKEAYDLLKDILRFPKPSEEADYVFVYPTMKFGKNCADWEKAFSTVATMNGRPANNRDDLSWCEKLDVKDGNYPEFKKITMFFDQYQKGAKNYQKVLKSQA